ncbi:hypothetical protein GQ53DRAFT_28173 [Thozetella sp. PMI_491]|nr:hypothetical protein GQ53DRAFT_28173 [Thozetella sp. PMI_491]
MGGYGDADWKGQRSPCCSPHSLAKAELYFVLPYSVDFGVADGRSRLSLIQGTLYGAIPETEVLHPAECRPTGSKLSGSPALHQLKPGELTSQASTPEIQALRLSSSPSWHDIGAFHRTESRVCQGAMRWPHGHYQSSLQPSGQAPYAMSRGFGAHSCHHSTCHPSLACLQVPFYLSPFFGRFAIGHIGHTDGPHKPPAAIHDITWPPPPSPRSTTFYPDL